MLLTLDFVFLILWANSYFYGMRCYVNCGIFFKSGSGVGLSDSSLFLEFMECISFTDRTFLENDFYMLLVKTISLRNHNRSSPQRAECTNNKNNPNVFSRKLLT